MLAHKKTKWHCALLRAVLALVPTQKSFTPVQVGQRRGIIKFQSGSIPQVG
jgi:hypothetical protein